MPAHRPGAAGAAGAHPGQGGGKRFVTDDVPISRRPVEAVRDAIAETIIKLPEELRRSLGWDRGSEMAQHARLRIRTGLSVYFADPHSP